ncbi:hypothetical protein ACFL6Y_06760 [Elusimicrobiota bacterium]
MDKKENPIQKAISLIREMFKGKRKFLLLLLLFLIPAGAMFAYVSNDPFGFKRWKMKGNLIKVKYAVFGARALGTTVDDADLPESLRRAKIAKGASSQFSKSNYGKTSLGLVGADGVRRTEQKTMEYGNKRSASASQGAPTRDTLKIDDYKKNLANFKGLDGKMKSASQSSSSMESIAGVGGSSGMGGAGAQNAKGTSKNRSGSQAQETLGRSGKLASRMGKMGRTRKLGATDSGLQTSGNNIVMGGGSRVGLEDATDMVNQAAGNNAQVSIAALSIGFDGSTTGDTVQVGSIDGVTSSMVPLTGDSDIDLAGNEIDNSATEGAGGPTFQWRAECDYLTTQTCGKNNEQNGVKKCFSIDHCADFDNSCEDAGDNFDTWCDKKRHGGCCRCCTCVAGFTMKIFVTSVARPEIQADVPGAISRASGVCESTTNGAVEFAPGTSSGFWYLQSSNQVYHQ